MFCGSCGNELPEGAQFCDKCGAMQKTGQEQAAPGDGVVQTPFAAEAQGAGNFTAPAQQASYMEPSKYSKVFVDPDEQLQGTLGNGYLENLLFGDVKRCHALLTDRRVYFQGRFLFENGKRSEWLISEEIVDLEDITGTGFIYSKPIGILMTLIYLVIPWIVAYAVYGFSGIDESPIIGLIGDVIVLLITIVRYILNRKTYFSVEYAGGAIKFNAKIIGVPAVRDFQKQVRRAKDRATGKS